MAAMKPAFKKTLTSEIQAGMSRGTLISTWDHVRELLVKEGLAWEEQVAPDFEALRASLRRRRPHMCQT